MHAARCSSSAELLTAFANSVKLLSICLGDGRAYDRLLERCVSFVERYLRGSVSRFPAHARLRHV